MGAVGKFVVSVDLELFWGLYQCEELDDWRRPLMSARQAIPEILELFRRFEVRATWAAVGFLFCRSRREMLDSLPQRLPAYQSSRISPYVQFPQVGSDESEDPWYFGPSLIDEIVDTRGQEIATHTLSNFHCLEEGQSGADFEADLRAALALARRHDILVRSLIFPENQVRQTYLPICRRLGISAYRGNPPVWPYEPRVPTSREGLRRWVRKLDDLVPLTGTRCVYDEEIDGTTPVNVPATRRLRAVGGSDLLEVLQRQRIFAELDRAARRGGLFHLWWRDRDFAGEPSRMLARLEAILERVAGWRRLGRLESLTMHEVVAKRTSVGAEQIEGQRSRYNGG